MKRFQLHVGQKHRRHKLLMRATKAVSLPWEDQIAALKEKTVIRLQRLFRKRRDDRIAKEKADEILAEKREERYEIK